MFEEAFEFVELRIYRIVGRQLSCELKLPYRRIERAVDVMGRTLILKPVMLVFADEITQHFGDPGFANAGFAREQHDLSLA